MRGLKLVVCAYAPSDLLSSMRGLKLVACAVLPVTYLAP